METRRIIIIGALIFFSTIVWYAPAYASKEFRSGNFRAGANVTVAVDEILAEDLTVAGANVKIAGELKQGLNAFGANLDISGSVDGELNAFGANIVLSGKFRKKVNAGAANIVIDGIFEDSLEVGAAKITIKPTAVIKGDLNYASAILDRQEGSQVLGQVAQKQKKMRPGERKERRSKSRKVAIGVKIIIWCLSLAALIIVGLIINTFFPEQTEDTVAFISESPWKNIGVGFVFLVAVPVAIMIAFITIIGIPAGIIAGFIYGLILYVSRIYIGVWMGRKIIGFFKKSQMTTFFWPFVVGIVTIAVIGLIPFVGWIFKLFCLLISLGALWLALWRAIRSKKTETG
jgi:cytoskeletal protein CcmA (bactofilin family)